MGVLYFLAKPSELIALCDGLAVCAGTWYAHSIAYNALITCT